MDSLDLGFAPLRRSAPQLLGLLGAWPDIVGSSFVTIPNEIFSVITAPWSLVPIPWPTDEPRRLVAWRAEAYSYHLLRLRSHHPSDVTWVARDDQTLGYDIEDRTNEEVQRVEVKGTRGNEVGFLLSAREHEIAHEEPETYTVHFWGQISLDRNPNSDFRNLTECGYPLIFQNLAAHLTDRCLRAVPTQYKVTLGYSGEGSS